MLRFAKVATPFTAFTVAVPKSVAPNEFESITTVTAFVAVVTVIPADLTMTTCIQGAIAAPAVALLGWTVMPSLVPTGTAGPDPLSPPAATARPLAGVEPRHSLDS